MRILSAFVMLAWSATIAADITGNIFTITIENPGASVSPGGELRFKIVGTHNSNEDDGYRVRIQTTDEDLFDNSHGFFGSVHLVWWHKDVPLNHPRYYKMVVKKDIGDVQLPKTITMSVYDNQQTLLTSTTFQIKDGNHGRNFYNVPNNRWYSVIHPTHDRQEIYEVHCISSTTGTCKFDVKDRRADNYHGHQPGENRHTCSDEGFPKQRLTAERSVVFDASDLVIESTDTHVPPTGYRSLERTTCLIYADNPFVIRDIDTGDVADHFTPAPAAPQ